MEYIFLRAKSGVNKPVRFVLNKRNETVLEMSANMHCIFISLAIEQYSATTYYLSIQPTYIF